MDASPPSSGRSPWRDVAARVVRNRFAAGGAIFLLGMVLLCALGPCFAPSYRNQDMDLGAVPPCAAHWLGTDMLGHDLLANLLIGGRISLGVGCCATLVALLIGVTYGAIAGACGGKIDAAMMRLVDILYALPFVIFVILLMVFSDALARRWNLGPAWNVIVLFAAIGAVQWLTMARIVRGQVASIRRAEFVEAARTLGFGRARILFRHIIPNVLGPVAAYATLTVPSVMLLEAFLSFLGLGVQPPLSSWGSLIKDGADQMEEFWWLLVFPCAAFSLTLLSINFLGDGLRDALDVRTAKD